MSREKQIIEIKECIDSVYGADCAYFDVDGFAIANKIYDAGYRKQSEGEWIYKFTLDGDKFYECSVCGRQEVVNCLCKERNLAEDRPYCHCGAKMKGGAE